jgi:hypothetical protein
LWAPGTWIYVDATAQYQWQPGHWYAAQQNWVWVPGYYFWTPSGAIWVNGYWDYPHNNRGILYAPLYVNFQRITPRTFVYTPSVYIDIDFAWLNLWVKPNYHHYFYGDFYADRYAGYGFTPWYSWAQTSRRFDPIFSFNLWTGGSAYLESVRGWHHYYRNTPQHRPRWTYNRQREHLAGLGSISENIRRGSRFAYGREEFRRVTSPRRNEFRLSPNERAGFGEHSRGVWGRGEARRGSERGLRGSPRSRPERVSLPHSRSPHRSVVRGRGVVSGRPGAITPRPNLPSRPGRPGIGGGERPTRPGIGGGERPTRPGIGGGERPTRPGIGGGERPSRPGIGGGERPSRPGIGGGERPSRPGIGGGERPTRPGIGGGERPTRPGIGGGERPSRPGIGGGERPTRPGIGGGERPTRPGRPGIGGGERPSRPGIGGGERPTRPGIGGEKDQLALESVAVKDQLFQVALESVAVSAQVAQVSAAAEVEDVQVLVEAVVVRDLLVKVEEAAVVVAAVEVVNAHYTNRKLIETALLAKQAFLLPSQTMKHRHILQQSFRRMRFLPNPSCIFVCLDHRRVRMNRA